MQRHARLPLPVNIQIPICQRGGSRCPSIRITNYWRLATGALASRREITSLLSSPIKPSFPSLALSFPPSYTHSTFVAGEARWAPSWRPHSPPRPVSFAPPLSLHRPRCFYTLVSRQGQVVGAVLFPLSTSCHAEILTRQDTNLVNWPISL